MDWSRCSSSVGGSSPSIYGTSSSFVDTCQQTKASKLLALLQIWRILKLHSARDAATQFIADRASGARDGFNGQFWPP
jgi:hypothetical protein